ncbi:uncharacterized protein GGS25DRAFT_520818 [Hypoxylon fragiforme]|uniref:uncharacterized protein n=1 Tax=Hypoxylon fragiforme TaxID=63214 RepID=UPI0020C6CE3A|nr:uncharacterized protein GGS25DRAFT_520818 [Hypoxylon fragiforme]KAI2610017.1 hypothetical protein GGS25DRAFT_520818 [Hypoxylon fragiforme]
MQIQNILLSLLAGATAAIAIPTTSPLLQSRSMDCPNPEAYEKAMNCINDPKSGVNIQCPTRDEHCVRDWMERCGKAYKCTVHY